MPISPQIVITPEDIVFKSFAISAVNYTSTTATYTATGHTFSVNDIVMITGLAPDGYNGTYTITSILGANITNAVGNGTNVTYTASNSYVAGEKITITGMNPAGYNVTNATVISANASQFVVANATTTAFVSGGTAVSNNRFIVSNTTNLALTDQTGNVYWADATEYEYDGGQTVAFIPNDNDVNDIVNTNETVAAAYAEALQAQADAAAAQASATTAYNTAIAANTAASTAQTTANGKNKVTYSTAAPGSTSNAAGDIWFQYGTTSPNVGRIIAQYMGNGGTSWTQTTVSGLVIANIDAGSITTGTLSVGLGITTGTGTFTVNAVTGALFANSATIQGQVNATSGYFGSSTNGFSINSTGLVGIGSGVIIGGTITTAASGARIAFNESASNSIRIYPDASLQPGYISASSVSGVGSLRINGPYTSGWNNSNIQLYSLAAGTSYIQLTGDVVQVVGGLSVSQGSLFSGSAQFSSNITYPGASTASGSTLVLVSTGSRIGFVSSSRKTKKNITALVEGTYLDKILSMEPVSFDWLDQPEDMPYRRNYGLIAEDTYLIPEIDSVVNLDQNGEPITISYDRITPFLVMAIKELQQEINQLKGE